MASNYGKRKLANIHDATILSQVDWETSEGRTFNESALRCRSGFQLLAKRDKGESASADQGNAGGAEVGGGEIRIFKHLSQPD